jgi:diguanylate cyclase (GGDEF)-like protein
MTKLFVAPAITNHEREVIQLFRDLPLARKFLVIPTLGLLLLGLIIGVAVNDAASHMTALKRQNQNGFLPLHRALLLKDRMTLAHARLFALLSMKATENDPVGLKNEADAIVETLGLQNGLLAALVEYVRGMVPDERLEALTAAYKTYSAAALNTIDVASGSAEYGAMMMTGTDDSFDRLRPVFDRLLDALSERLDRRTETVITHARLAEIAMIVLGGVAAILTVFGSIAVGLSITRPIIRLTNIVRRLADGDTTAPAPDIGRGDEIGEIARAVEIFRRNAIAKQVADVALTKSTRQLDLALNNMSQGLCLFDREGRLQLHNRRFHEVTGIPSNRIWDGLPYRDLLAASAAAGLVPASVVEISDELLTAAIAGGAPSRLETGVPNGRSVMISRQPLPEGGWVATYEDTTEIRRSEERIVYLARHDPLTGLPNRRLFRERLDQALARVARGECFAVLCLDLDHFKNVNDTFGHDVGDSLLRMVAERLQSCVREVDIVARLGGDEFAILQEDITAPGSASLLAERIVEVIRGTYEIGGHKVITSASIGIAMAPATAASADALLKNADVALYFAKQGRGCFTFFEPGMGEHLQQRRVLEMELQGAVARQEFELHYQPLVAIDSGRVMALEALVRWHHPVRGLTAPDDFIRLAEETGLIVPLGEWILTTACREAVTWPDDIKVAVNLSPVQFKGNQPYEMVAQALHDSHLPAWRLELEITESVLMNDNEQTLAMLHRLRGLGVAVSMDDFGTGYSSLSYLQKFPFDKIKIDRSFVGDIARKQGTLEIVRAITGLSRGLGMTTVAEGVETQEQLERLRMEGCVEVQGFLFSKPVAGPDVAAMLVRVNARGLQSDVRSRLDSAAEAA